MIKFVNECVGCSPERGCLGNACPYSSIPRFYCDECKDDVDPDDLYDLGDGKMLCRECALKHIKAPASRWLED